SAHDRGEQEHEAGQEVQQAAAAGEDGEGDEADEDAEDIFGKEGGEGDGDPEEGDEERDDAVGDEPLILRRAADRGRGGADDQVGHGEVHGLERGAGDVAEDGGGGSDGHEPVRFEQAGGDVAADGVADGIAAVEDEDGELEAEHGGGPAEVNAGGGIEAGGD